MGVLIRGMTKPADCLVCIFNIDGCCIINRELEPDDKLTHSCPLIEVPTPHGRLIDADALRLLYDFNGYKPTGDMTEEEFDRLMCRLPVIRANIDDMPTILEAVEET